MFINTAAVSVVVYCSPHQVAAGLGAALFTVLQLACRKPATSKEVTWTVTVRRTEKTL